MDIELWYKKNQRKVIGKMLKQGRSYEDCEDILQNTTLRLLDYSKTTTKLYPFNHTNWAHIDLIQYNKYHEHDVLFDNGDIYESDFDLDLEILKKELPKLLNIAFDELDKKTLKNNRKNIFIKRFLYEEDYDKIGKDLSLHPRSVREDAHRTYKFIIETIKKNLE